MDFIYIGETLDSEDKVREEAEAFLEYFNSEHSQEHIAEKVSREKPHELLFEFAQIRGWAKDSQGNPHSSDLKAVLSYYGRCYLNGPPAAEQFLNTPEGKREIIARRRETSTGSEEGLERETPSQAFRKITPEGFKSPDEYVNAKMGALIGAGGQARGIKKRMRAHEERQEADAEIRRRIDLQDKEAVLDFIAYPNDPGRLADPFVIQTIREWQEIVEKTDDLDEKFRVKDKLKTIGAKLNPPHRGVKKGDVKNIEDDVLRYRSEKEWVWYHALKLFDSLGYRNLDFRHKEVVEAFESYGLSKDYIEDMLIISGGYKVGKNMLPRYLAIATQETADKFKIKPETVQKILANYG